MESTLLAIHWLIKLKTNNVGLKFNDADVLQTYIMLGLLRLNK